MAMKKHIMVTTNQEQNVGRDTVVVWGIVASGLLLLGMIALDGIIFYQTVNGNHLGMDATQEQEGITVEEIDEVIAILDVRDKKFKEVVGQGR